MWQKQPRLDTPDGVIDQGCELLALLVGNGGPQVLNFDETLAHENNLGDFVDPSHPRIADKLRIECRNAGRFFWISRGGRLPLQNTWRAVQFTNRSEEHTSELQSLRHLVCRLLLEKKHS